MGVKNFCRLTCDTCDVTQDIAEGDERPSLIQPFSIRMGGMDYFNGHLCDACRKRMRVAIDGALQEYLRQQKSGIAA